MTKEAAREEAWIRYLKTNPTIATDKWAFVQGFDAGYESARGQWTAIDAFKELKMRLANECGYPF